RARLRLRPDLHPRRPSGRAHDGRAHRCREGRDQSSRPRRPRAGGMARRVSADVVSDPTRPPGRTPAALVSIASNSLLILLKVVAGSLTGSVAILTEAMHSAIDLIASIVAFFSVRKAEEPADETHRYGHEKLENLAAGIEGILILLGAAVIAFEAIRRLVRGGQLQLVGIGITVVGFSLAVNLVVSGV